jgi:hypothetical protein
MSSQTEAAPEHFLREQIGRREGPRTRSATVNIFAAVQTRGPEDPVLSAASHFEENS